MTDLVDAADSLVVVDEVNEVDWAEGQLTSARQDVLSGFLSRWMLLASCERSGHKLRPDEPHFERADHSQSGEIPDKATCYLPLNMVHQTEPRIISIGQALGALSYLFSWRDESGTTCKPDGFRLENLGAWRTDIRPGDIEPIEHYLAAGVCNVACEFCYEFGTPVEMRTPKQRVNLSEMNTRLKYFDPERGRALFDIFHQYYDAFSHPNCIEFLKIARQRSDSVLDLISNGRTLTPRIIDALKSLMPVHLTISLNSADPEKRKIVMRDKTPEVAAKSLPLLAKAGIPFGIVIVPWPPLIDEDDMEATIDFVSQFDPNFVSVSLPGYSQFLPNVPADLTEDFHTRIIARIRKLRRRYQVPLLTQPRLAEAEQFGERHETPFVLGTTPNSAARDAGFAYGDEITHLNAIPVNWSYDVTRLLELLELTGQEQVKVQWRRQGKVLSKNLHRTKLQVSQRQGFGLIVGQGIGASTLKPIINSLNAGERVWALSSRWMKPTVMRMMSALAAEPSILTNLDIKVVHSRYFAGNIELGDLLVTSDFEHFLREAQANGGLPERVFIPLSPFSGWKRDMRGQDAERLRREFGDIVTFLPNARITV